MHNQESCVCELQDCISQVLLQLQLILDRIVDAACVHVLQHGFDQDAVLLEVLRTRARVSTPRSLTRAPLSASPPAPLAAWAAVFALATLAKAWEPLSVAYAAPEQGVSFAALLILCEAIKLLLTIPLLIVLTRGLHMGQLCSKESVAWFGVPAAFLAITNHSLGFAIPRLDGLLYQVLFKSLSIVTTALLTTFFMQQKLKRVQWGAIMLLLLGSFVCEAEGVISPSESTVSRSASRLAGLLAVLVGAVCFALQAVYFERAAGISEKPESHHFEAPAQAWYLLGSKSADLKATHTIRQIVALAWWGLCVNSLIYAGIEGPSLLLHARARMHFPTIRGWIVACSIAAADVSMAVFLTVLGSNAYSFSRVLALLVSSVIAAFFLQQPLTPIFACGASLVALSAWVYREPDAAARFFRTTVSSDVSHRVEPAPQKTAESETLLSSPFESQRASS
ncbi:MAG: hypothetical protein SGPRY_005206 [Prymnesium sp.]